VCKAQRLGARSRRAAGAVDRRSQESHAPQQTSYSNSQLRFTPAKPASALRAQATLTAIITQLPLLKIENNQALHIPLL